MRLLSVCAVLGVLFVPVGAAAEWRQLPAGNMLVIGEVGDDALREAAVRLQRFRQLLAALHPDVVPEQESAPLVTVVFESNGAFRPFLPRVDGRVVRLDGLFQPGEDVNFIAVSLAGGDAAFSTIFHEYTHLLMSAAFADAPLWFTEGLAEYYRTATMTADGQRGTVGAPIAPYLNLLRRRSLPLDDLFAVDRSSDAYTENSVQRELLYAQAWAVVHHAFHGSRERGGQLLELARRVAAGETVAAVLPEVYGMTVGELEQEVRLHVRRPVYTRRSVLLDTGGEGPSVPARILSDAEAGAYLGHLLAKLGRLDEAAERLEAVVEAAPELALAHAFLGALRMRQGRTSEGIGHLEQAVVAGTDNPAILLQYASALVESDPGDGAARARAASALERARQLRPGYTEATLLLAYVYAIDRDHEAVRALLVPVVSREPGNHRAALRLAEAHIALDEVDRARPLLARVLARTTRPDDERRARTLMVIADALDSGQPGQTR